MAALSNRADHYIFALWFLLLSFSLSYSPPSQSGCLPYFHTWCGLSANLRCRSETCCTQLAARWKYRTQKLAKQSPSGHRRTTLSGSVFATKGTYRQSELFSSNISYTCSHNMVNFGPLTVEIGSVIWGTPPNVNGFCVLAVLLHGTLVVGVSQTLRRWTHRGRHLYSARRPSRWALAHISSLSWR